MTSRCFTHFPVSVALRVGKENKQGHPSTGAIWCLMAPFKVGVDWWRTRCTEESQASELQIDKHNIKTCIHTSLKLVCDRSMNRDTNGYYSDLNFLILWVSQITADNRFLCSRQDLTPCSLCLVRNNIEFSVHCPLLLSQEDSLRMVANS